MNCPSIKHPPNTESKRARDNTCSVLGSEHFDGHVRCVVTWPPDARSLFGVRGSGVKDRDEF